MSLQPVQPQLLMIDLDQPTYNICAKTGTLAGLYPIFTISASLRVARIVQRAKYVAAVILDAETCTDTFKTVASVQEDFSEVPLVVVTRRENDSQSRLALRLGASHAVKKPCDPAELDRIFRFIVETRAACEFHNGMEIKGKPEEGIRARVVSPNFQNRSRNTSLMPDSLASSIKPPIPVVCRKCCMEFFAADEHSSMCEIEKKAIFAAIDAAEGDKLRAAEILGIGKTTIYRKLQSYRREIAPDVSVRH